MNQVAPTASNSINLLHPVCVLLLNVSRGLQHRIHCAVLGGLYPGAELVERALAPEWGTEKAILDVGTGPGHWCALFSTSSNASRASDALLSR